MLTTKKPNRSLFMEYTGKPTHTVYRGDGMDKQAIISPEAGRELELEIMLHINERLFQKGTITQEMRNKAVELILKS